MELVKRMMEITLLLVDKVNLLNAIDKEAQPQEYQGLVDEIAVLKSELQDLSQIGIADSEMALEQSDKNLEIISQHVDFNSLETEDYLLLAKFQKFEENARQLLDIGDDEIIKNDNEDGKND